MAESCVRHIRGLIGQKYCTGDAELQASAAGIAVRGLVSAMVARQLDALPSVEYLKARAQLISIADSG